MERYRAVEVIKQILESCGCPSVTLLLQPNNNLSNGVQIQVENKESYLSAIQKIAKRNGLLVKKEGAHLILYKPEESNKRRSKP